MTKSVRGPLVASCLAIALSLSGCSPFRQPAPQIRSYRIDYAAPEAGETPLSAVVSIAPLAVAAAYDSEAIVYREDAYSLGRYFYHRWATNPGNLLSDLLARDLAQTGDYRAVQHARAPLASDYQVTGEVDEIEERTAESGCAARLRLRLLIVRQRASEKSPVLLQRTYVEEEPCPCGDVGAFTAAMSRAVERISSDLRRRLYDAIQSDLGG